jgi:pimeloyl-ACP methyl ester carboxylesterase
MKSAACCRIRRQSNGRCSARALMPARRSKRSGSPTSSHSWVRQNRITCPLLVMVGGEDKLVPSSEGERLAKTASGPKLVVYPKGDHVCFNISYKYRPLTADWMAERLGAGQT